MRKIRGDHLRQILDEMTNLGVTVERIERGTHHKIYWRRRDQKGVLIVSVTPSEYRGTRNKIAELKRTLGKAA